MSKFEHLKQLDVKSDTTAEIRLYEIEANNRVPILIVRPATQANKNYLNALLKETNTQRIHAKRINSGVLAENRNKDRVLFPLHVVTDWRDVVDEDGNDVPYTVENCQDLLEAIPDWLFDNIRDFCQDTSNFISVPDSRDISKN